MLALMGSLLLGALTTHCAKMKVQMCNGGWQEKMAFLLCKLKIQKSVINCDRCPVFIFWSIYCQGATHFSSFSLMVCIYGYSNHCCFCTEIQTQASHIWQPHVSHTHPTSVKKSLAYKTLPWLYSPDCITCHFYNQYFTYLLKTEYKTTHHDHIPHLHTYWTNNFFYSFLVEFIPWRQINEDKYQTALTVTYLPVEYN